MYRRTVCQTENNTLKERIYILSGKSYGAKHQAILKLKPTCFEHTHTKKHN